MNATIKTSGAPVQGAGPDEKSLILQLWRRAHGLTENERGQLCDLIRARFIRVARARYPGGFTPQDREDLASEFILQKILTNPVEATSRAPENDAHLNSFVRNFCMDAFRKRRTVQSNEVCCDDLDSLGDEGGSDGAAVEFPEESSDGAGAEFAESGLMEDDPNLALRAMKFVNDLPGRIASPRANDTGMLLFHLAHGLQTFAGDETLPRKMDYVRVYGVGWNKDLAVRIGADGALIKAFLDSGNKKFLQTPVANWLMNDVELAIRDRTPPAPGETVEASQCRRDLDRLTKRALATLARVAKTEWELRSAPVNQRVRAFFKRELHNVAAVSW
jgi:hypothetical protein